MSLQFVLCIFTTHYIQLCCCLVSKLIDTTKVTPFITYRRLHQRRASGGPQPSTRRMRIVSARRTVDEYDTSRYQEATASARIIDDRCLGTAAEHHRCSQSRVSGTAPYSD